MKKIFLILAVFLVCGCVSEPQTITGNIVGDSQEMNLEIDKIDCSDGKIFLRNTGQSLNYDEINFFLNNQMEHPCDVGWLKYWESQEGNVTFPEGRIMGAFLGKDLSGREVEVFYEGNFMDRHFCK